MLCSELTLVCCQIHWARVVPNEMKDVVDMYIFHDCAAKYRQMDKEANNGNLPEKTVLNNNICFCLVRPTYDQCADPIYTQVHLNFESLSLRASL